MTPEIKQRLANFGPPKRIEVPEKWKAWREHFEWAYQKACKECGIEPEPLINTLDI